MAKELIQPEHYTKNTFETEEEFMDHLNECYPPINICGIIMNQVKILKEMDPIAFSCAMSDDNEETEIYICPICGDEFEEDEEGAKFCCQSEEEEETEE